MPNTLWENHRLTAFFLCRILIVRGVLTVPSNDVLQKVVGLYQKQFHCLTFLFGIYQGMDQLSNNDVTRWSASAPSAPLWAIMGHYGPL